MRSRPLPVRSAEPHNVLKQMSSFAVAGISSQPRSSRWRRRLLRRLLRLLLEATSASS